MKFFILMIKHKGEKKVLCFACKKSIHIDELGGVMKLKDKEGWIHSRPECLIVLAGSYPTPNPASDKRKKNFMERTLHDIMADFMVDLCEQKRHDKHICQPNNKLWIKNHKRFEGFIKSALRKQKKEIIEDVCLEIACFSPLGAEESIELLKIIRGIK